MPACYIQCPVVSCQITEQTNIVQSPIFRTMCTTPGPSLCLPFFAPWLVNPISSAVMLEDLGHEVAMRS